MTISVAQNQAGMWMMTIDGVLVGDSRPQSTREAAIAYARKLTAGWQNVTYSF